MATYIIIIPLIAGNSRPDNQQPSLNSEEGSTTIM